MSDDMWKAWATDETTLEEAFNTIDGDGGGTIDMEELGNTFRKFGGNVSQAELDGIVEIVDADGDGQPEFLAVGSSAGTLQYFLRNGDGSYTEQTGADNPFDFLAGEPDSAPAFVPASALALTRTTPVSKCRYSSFHMSAVQFWQCF